MIESVTITNSKEESITLELSNPWSSGFGITDISGLGPVTASINTTSYATRDGSVFNSARLDNRNIVFTLIFLPTDNESVEDIRQRSYRYFPIKGLITLVFKTTNRTCRTSGYVESNEPNIFSKRQTAQISVICPDPYFYDDNSKQKITFMETVPLFSFPFTNKGTDVKTIKMGEIQRRAIKAFEYSGEGRSGIELFLYFSGGVTGVITIANETTSQKILIDTSLLPNGYLLKNGDRIRILTYSGDKQVRLWKYDKENERYLNYNILNCVGSGSDWLEVLNGSNSITVSAENGGDNIDVTVITTVKYEGL